MTHDQVIQRALKILGERMRTAPALASPDAVRDYLRLLLHDREHEVFVCVYLDAQHRVIAYDELFRGTLAQTSVYPARGRQGYVGTQRGGGCVRAQPSLGGVGTEQGRRAAHPGAEAGAGVGGRQGTRPLRRCRGRFGQLR